MTLAYRIDGSDDAPPLLLLSSMGATTEMWDPCLTPLAEQFRVVRMDNRGHGGSAPQPPTEGVTMADLARDVLDTLDTLELPRVHVAGNSIGGMAALWLAIHRPERVGRIALVCTSAAPPNRDGFRARAEAVRNEGMSGALSTTDRWITAGLRERDPELAGRLRTMLASIDAQSYAECCEAISTFDVVADLARIGAPTLVVTGAQDEALPAEHGRLIASSVVGARYVELAPAGHIPTYEQGGAVAALLVEHFGGGATLDAGFAVRRAVLGDQHVDRAVAATTPFTAPFQDFITRYAWGDVWNRPGLERRERSLLTLACLVTLGAEQELAMHVRGAVRNGLRPDEIAEALLHTAVYAGVPRANRALAIARETLDELT
jgi:3-oxoadipate enol-lactonase / 4-carboxymuconolactone decarboxylase